MEAIPEPMEAGSFGWVYSPYGYPLPAGLEEGTLVKILAMRSGGTVPSDQEAQVETAEGRRYLVRGASLEMRCRYRFSGEETSLPERHPRVQAVLARELKNAEEAEEKTAEKAAYLRWKLARSRGGYPKLGVFRKGVGRKS